jgi:hypothetical protein
MARDSRFSFAEAAGANPLDLASARITSARDRMGGIPSHVLQADYEDQRGIITNRSAGLQSMIARDRGRLTGADYKNELEMAKQVKDATFARYEGELQRIERARQAANELVSTQQSAYEKAIGQRRGLEEGIATMSPSELARTRRAAGKADKGEELTRQEAASLRNVPGYESAAIDAFQKIARKKAPELFKKVDEDIGWRRESRDLALEGASVFNKDRTQTITLESGVKLDVKMSLDEASVTESMTPLFEKAIEDIRIIMAANAQKIASDLQTDEATKNTRR